MIVGEPRTGSRRARALAIGVAAALTVATAAEPADAQASSQPHAHTSRTEPAAAVPTPAGADEQAFLRAARAGTERYRDLANARADGYRRVGGELPSLGEHWVHNGRALADTLDPGAPPILVYATVRERPVLAGVAYIRFIGPSDPYPAFPTSVSHAWHDHNGGVDEEVLPLGHLVPDSAPPQPSSPARLRIAVMHAWIGIDNPAGIWTSENWGLPYARAALAPAAGPGGADARALSLMDASPYYLRAIASVGKLDAGELTRARTIVTARTLRVRLLVDSLARVPERHRDILAPRDIDALAAEWRGMWSALLADVRPESAARLRPLIEALGSQSGVAAPHNAHRTTDPPRSAPPE